ncbi:ATP-binding cassette domain-containing protein [Telmatospirillum sp.]|uniref:ABC transporter ATP-binding protein n=1 Tax=Telmatospirillum sp. TaxID=2079197 RepID=UPI002845A5A8|nr:ATP-binding cassette domain-containing protein [Telmatospirillum sp.]MDR3435606.1 ATP-binding cassette domain-containing protein [Telmatospirillum sp.]
MLTVSHLKRPGLVDASFSLSLGECVAVRGPSGAGKSLLLRAIADLDPSDGEVSLEGCPRNSMSGPQWRQLVGYLPAEPGWWADRVGQHFRDWAAAKPLLDRLGLPDEARDWPLTRPSTGERIRLALIRALANDPKVLLLDEPTAALDAVAVAAVEALMAERVAAGLAVLWVTHDAAQGERVARRFLRIEAGQVVNEECRA